MLKKLLAERGKSVYSASKESGIAYTTLNELVNKKKNIGDCSVKTLAALSAYLNLSIESLLFLLSEKDTQTVKQTWQENRKKKYRFPVIKDSGSYDASRIHPLKQRTVFSVAESFGKDEHIDQIILFGSSTTIRCNKGSDLDFAIMLKEGFVNSDIKNEVSEKLQDLCGWKADIIWLDRVEPGSRLFDNIMKGVRVL